MTCQTCDDEGVVDAADPTGCFLGVLREACPDCKPGHSDPVADWIGRHWHLRYDPVWNTLMAKKIRDAYGFRMWACA